MRRFRETFLCTPPDRCHTVGRVRIETIPVSPWTANCYLIAADPDENGCLVVDPGVKGSELVSAALNRLGWHPEVILCTHGHLDHVGDAATLAAIWDVPVRCAKADQEMLTRPSAGLGTRLVPLIRQLLGEDLLERPADLRDHEVFQVPCGLEIRPHIAPGHTPGSTLLEVEDDTGKVLLTGDVIFRGTIGRTDLPGGDLEQMRITLRRIVETFPDETVLLPGHGEPTTVGTEKLHNPYLQADFLKD